MDIHLGLQSLWWIGATVIAVVLWFVPTVFFRRPPRKPVQCDNALAGVVMLCELGISAVEAFPTFLYRVAIVIGYLVFWIVYLVCTR